MICKTNQAFSFRKASDKTLKSIENNLFKLDSFVSGNGCEKELFDKEVSTCFKLIDTLCRELSQNINDKVRSDENNYDDLSIYIPVRASINHFNSSIYIHVDSLPPKRVEKKRRNIILSENIYLSALSSALKESEIKMLFQTRCLINFKFFFNIEEQASDLDNYDLKNIIDWIKVNFLIEDSYPYVALLIEGEPTNEKSYMDINLRPY